MIDKNERLPAGHQFMVNLEGGGRLEKIKAAGVFRGASKVRGQPTNKEIINEMNRLAREVYDCYYEEFPSVDTWVLNYYRQPGKRMRVVDAFLLSASFGLTIGTFAAPNREFEHALALAKRGKNLAEPSFELLTSFSELASADEGHLDVRHADQPPRTRACLDGEEEILEGEHCLVHKGQPVLFEIQAPAAFSDGCEVVLLERDHTGGVYCCAPSKWVKPPDGGDSVLPGIRMGARAELPRKEGDGVAREGKIKLGTLGRSVVAAVLNHAQPLALPRRWWRDDLFPNDIAHDLEPLVEALAMRDPSTWRVVTRSCLVE